MAIFCYLVFERLESLGELYQPFLRGFQLCLQTLVLCSQLGVACSQRYILGSQELVLGSQCCVFYFELYVSAPLLSLANPTTSPQGATLDNISGQPLLPMLNPTGSPSCGRQNLILARATNRCYTPSQDERDGSFPCEE
jgi:hypothetical protein